MKSITIFLLAPFFCTTHLFAQTLKTKPLEEKIATPVAGSQNLHAVAEQKKPAPPPPTNIQSVLLDIQNGDDGKEAHTYVRYDFEDNSKRVAATYFDGPKTPVVQGGLQAIMTTGPSDEYIAGSAISVPIPTQMSIPTGQTMKVGAITVPELRWASVADFGSGGELKITLNSTSNGHEDIWKVQTITAKVYFENDPHSPHIIKWSNVVLSSQGAPVRELFFDQNYKPL